MPCETFQCGQYAEYTILRKDAPPTTGYNLCGGCAKDLVTNIPKDIAESLTVDDALKEEIGKLNDFILKHYIHEIPADESHEGVSAVDLAIKILSSNLETELIEALEKAAEDGMVGRNQLDDILTSVYGVPEPEGDESDDNASTEETQETAEDSTDESGEENAEPVQEDERAEDNVDNTEKPLDDMGYQELKQVAKQEQLKGYTTMNKKTLLKELKALKADEE
jgi:hypothetical protein